MSHTTTIKAIKIASITALQAAIRELSEQGVPCTLKENATPRAYFQGQQGMGKADFVLELTNSRYDIGFYKSEDGTYEARTDFWGKDVERILGAQPGAPERAEQAKLGKLYQLYAINAATETARRAGHSVRRKTQTDGSVTLEITGTNL